MSDSISEQLLAIIRNALLKKKMNTAALAELTGYSRKDIKKILSFYSQGINFRLKEIQKQGLGRGSPEFFFYSPEVTP
ncbi:MAG: hypothetical protein VX026_04510, partial [Myxococcota bacterium]|nr:hypothetical protein [Myxococcota bacterium]